MTLSLPVAKPRKPPRVDHAPESGSYAAAEEALGIAELAGLTLDDWQKYALVRSMGQSASGLWSAFESGLIVPRQNGKTEVLVARCLAALFSTAVESRMVIYTAHEYKTAREVFIRTRGLLDPPRDADPLTVADPHLTARIEKVRTANGEESIELDNGRRLRFLARTSGSGRGFTGDLVILDESYKLTAEQMAALLPTLSARPNPQVFYASMGPFEESEQQLQVRERGLAGGEGLCYLEWSVPDDGTLDDESGWLASNPASPHRISLDHMRREREAFGDEEFARERLCLHNAARRQAVIDADLWASLERDEAELTGVGFSVDVPPERNSASIGMGGFVDGKKIQVKQDSQPGTTWAVDRLASLAKKYRAPVGLDPAGPAGSLIPKLVKAGVDPVLITGREMAQACGAFYDMVHNDELYHIGDDPVLAAAVDAGRKRSVGDAWAWHRRDTAANISPLVSITVAAHVVSNPPDPPREKTGRAAFY